MTLCWYNQLHGRYVVAWHRERFIMMTGINKGHINVVCNGANRIEW